MTIILKFFINSDKNLDRMESAMRQLLSGNSEVKRSENKIDYSCDAFMGGVEQDCLGIQFASEDYQIPLRYKFVFFIYRNYKGWQLYLMKVIGGLMRDYGSDCILLYYGESLCLKRTNNELIVDMKRWPSSDRSYFDMLGLEYVEGNLEQ